MVVLEPHASQQFLVKVDHVPSKIKVLMSVYDTYPQPVITKIIKKGQPTPIKDFKG